MKLKTLEGGEIDLKQGALDALKMRLRGPVLLPGDVRFNFEGKLIQGLEHFMAVEIDRDDVTSCEDHLCFHWLPIDRLAEYDLRPHVARDAVASGDYLRVKHLQVPLAES